MSFFNYKNATLFKPNRKEKPYKQRPTTAKKIDISSTGDTVIAIITMALQAGCSIKESVYLANYAEE